MKQKTDEELYEEHYPYAMYPDQEVLKLMAKARAAGRAEQRDSDRLTPEMLTTAFPNSIKRSVSFGYGVIESQGAFLEEFRRYVLDARDRGRAEGAEEQKKSCEEIAIGYCERCFLDGPPGLPQASFHKPMEHNQQAHEIAGAIREQGEK